MRDSPRFTSPGWAACILLGGLALARAAGAAPPPRRPVALRLGTGLAGQLVYLQHCAACHVQSGAPRPGEARAPTLHGLQQLPPERIYHALTRGRMRPVGAGLDDAARRAVAAWLGGRPLGASTAGEARHMAHRCPVHTPVPAPASGDWNGWGNGVRNLRDQPHPGFPLSDVPRLTLQWAFGFPDGAETYSQPTVVGHRVLVGDDNGFVYSLDARRGCVQWSFRAHAGVRTAPTVARLTPGGPTAVFFGDMQGYVYALDSATGRAIWITRVDHQPTVKITGAPVVADGRLYVGTTTGEEVTAADPHYPCCRTRGTVSALDVATGRILWKTDMVAPPPRPVGRNTLGTTLWAPAGVGVWSTPTVDRRLGLLLVGTGDAYTYPAAPLSDSIVALELRSGVPLWHYQATRNDAWLAGCVPGHPFGNCPKVVGPDWDFGDSPMLLRGDGRQWVVGAHKGGRVVALDPEARGRVLWRRALARGPVGPGGEIVFGGASDGRRLFYGLDSGAIVALSAADGHVLWRTRVISRIHRGGISSAVTAMPGAVFTGAWDGVLRAYAARNGRLLWSFDTARPFRTVNGVAAHGGSMGAPGPTIAEGRVFVGSGYIGVGNGMAGNVLLAFAPRARTGRRPVTDP